jgi:protein involved in polysaccharide export with SLBB domain
MTKGVKTPCDAGARIYDWTLRPESAARICGSIPGPAVDRAEVSQCPRAARDTVYLDSRRNGRSAPGVERSPGATERAFHRINIDVVYEEISLRGSRRFCRGRQAKCPEAQGVRCAFPSARIRTVVQPIGRQPRRSAREASAMHGHPQQPEEPRRRRRLAPLVVFFCIAAGLPARMLGQNADPSQSTGLGQSGTQNSIDCSSPIFASSAACTTQMPGANGALDQQQSGNGGISLGTANLGMPLPNTPRSYSDMEQPSAPQAPQSEQGLPPEPLTEFQKFIASTTGQILPIYGADLFRRVPSTFAPLNLTPVPPDYVIGPGDELRIRVWGQVNTQANVTVDRAGDIYLPQVGQIHVAGIAFAALADHLRDAIQPVFRNFQLTADLGQTRAIQVYVTGSARRPGVYTVSSLSTLIDALFASGGPSVSGSLRAIELRRGNATVTTFDMYALLIHGDKSKDSTLADGDVIFIPPVGPQAALTGSVENAAIYELRPGETLGDLTKEAGGPSVVAAQTRISIERIDDHRDRHAMEVAYDPEGLALPLADGDLIRVLSIAPSYLKTVTLRGNTANPGRFAWHAGMHVSELIPDKESLLTRNYWWKRTQLGLPAPEFEPAAQLSRMRQPADGHASSVELSPQQIQNTTNAAEMEASQAAMQPASPGGSAPAQAGALANQAAAAQNPDLNASQRASHSSLASDQTAQPGRVVPPAEKNQVQLLAPEINWSYAVVERLDSGTLKTKLIPFDLGKLVLEHDASQDLELQPGDVVTVFSEADFRVPAAQQTKLVTVEGEFVHSGVYSVQPGETLRDLVERAGGLTADADLYGSEFTRESTRAIQQARIDEYIQNLNLDIERGTLALQAAPAASPGDLASSAAAVGSERQLLATLSQIRATGRVVLQFKPESQGLDSIPPIALEDGDHFSVPPVPATINVVGAVYDQNSFLFANGRRVAVYLHMAGGPNKNADRKHEFVIRADGEVVSHDMTKGLWGNEFDELAMNPGDTIVIPEKTLKPSILRGVLDWSQFFSQFALGAAALTVIAP